MKPKTVFKKTAYVSASVLFALCELSTVTWGNTIIPTTANYVLNPLVDTVYTVNTGTTVSGVGASGILGDNSSNWNLTIQSGAFVNGANGFAAIKLGSFLPGGSVIFNQGTVTGGF